MLEPTDIVEMRSTAQAALATVTRLDNAALVEIRAPGAVDGYGERTALGAVVWAGEAPGTLGETDERELDTRLTTQGGEAAVQKTVFVTNWQAGSPPVETVGPDSTGSTVLIEDRRVTPAVQRRFRVISMEDRTDVLLAGSVRLVLDDEG